MCSKYFFYIVLAVNITAHSRYYFLLLFYIIDTRVKIHKKKKFTDFVNPNDSIDDIELTKCVYGKRIKKEKISSTLYDRQRRESMCVREMGRNGLS